MMGKPILNVFCSGKPEKGLPGSFKFTGLRRIEKLLEAFAAELGREQNRILSGAGRKINLERIYERYRPLFTPEMVKMLVEKGRGQKRWRYLAEFLASNFIDSSLRENTDALMSAEMDATVEYEGKVIPYRKVPALIANEEDTHKRHSLYELYGAKTQEHNSLRIEHFSRLNDYARRLGFKDYIGLFDNLRGFKLHDLTSTARTFLMQTRDAYFDGLQGFGFDLAWVCDMHALFRAPQFDRYFGSDRLLPVLRSTLNGLGIDLDRQTNISLDSENRPLKHPRSFCVAIKIPDEIVLTVYPRGGWVDYRSTFHEIGHAQHFAHTDRHLPFAYKYCGDGSVTEVYGYLFENLVSNRLWLGEGLNMLEPAAYLKLINYFRLYRLRRLAVEVIYEQELFKSPDISKMAKTYADLFSEHLGVRFDERQFLSNVDKGFYCGFYLRAFAFEVQLRRFLEAKFGKKWFFNPKAGEALKNLWKHGLELDAEELAVKLGLGRVSFDPLRNELIRANSQ